MPALPVAVATRCFNLPIRDGVRAASEAGARAIQIDVRDELGPQALSDTGRKEFLRYLDEVGLKVASLTVPTRLALYDQEQLDARMEVIKTCMQFAWQLKSRVLTLRIGKIPTDTASREYLLLHDVISDLARHGNHVGVTPTLISSGDSIATLADFTASIKTGLLGLDFDPAGLVFSNQNPEKALRALYQSVTHVQGRDGIRDIDTGGSETPVGRGEVDWIALLPLLEEVEYRGWLTVLRTQGEDRAGDVQRAIKYFQQVQFS